MTDDRMWTEVEYGGHTFKVPATGRHEHFDAMLTDIPGQDDTVTPLKLTDQRFYKWAMAFLMQDGDLAVPGGRFGICTRSCAEVAIIMSLIMQYHDGEPITYYKLNSDMGMVVNSSDDIPYLFFEYAELVFDGRGFGPLGNDPIDITDYIDEEDIDECKARRAAEYGE